MPHRLELLRASVVAYYQRKPPQLLDLIGRVQEEIQGSLRASFLPYDPDQVHATIVGLESVLRGDQLVNRNFLEFRGQTRIVSLGSVVARLQDTNLLPMQVQIGGFRPGVDYGFRSRGRGPHARSFSLQEGAAVGMGWPVQNGQYPDSLDRLRRLFQDVNVLHKYHRRPGDVDNDLYFVMGRCLTPVSEADRDRTEQEMRRYFSAHPCVIPLGREDLAVACYTDEALPAPTTAAIPVTIDEGAADRVIREASMAALRA